MPLEPSFATINLLNGSWPLGTDEVDQGDDHFRGIKTAIKGTFPNISGVVNPSHNDINSMFSTIITTGSVIQVNKQLDMQNNQLTGLPTATPAAGLPAILGTSALSKTQINDNFMVDATGGISTTAGARPKGDIVLKPLSHLVTEITIPGARKLNLIGATISTLAGTPNFVDVGDRTGGTTRLIGSADPSIQVGGTTNPSYVITHYGNILNQVRQLVLNPLFSVGSYWITSQTFTAASVASHFGFGTWVEATPVTGLPAGSHCWRRTA